MVRKLEIFEKIGFNIKKYRVEQNISLKELSNKTGINIKYLSRIEKTKAIGMRMSHLFIIASALDIKVSMLLKKANPKQ